MGKIYSLPGFESGSTRFPIVGAPPPSGGGPPPGTPPGGSLLCTAKTGTQTDLSGQGTRTTQYSNNFAATDAGHRWYLGLGADVTTFAMASPTAQHIQKMGNANGCCIYGGKCHGPLVDNQAYDTGWHSSTGLKFGVGHDWLVERFHGWMLGDVFRMGQDWFSDGPPVGPGGPQSAAESSFMDNWVIRDSSGQDAHDDISENDWLAAGIYSNCFFSGFSLFSGRPANAFENNPGITGVGRKLQLLRVGAWLKPQSMIGASTFSNGGAIQADWVNKFFKWPTGSITPKSMTVLAENCAFRYDGDGRPNELSGGSPTTKRWGLSNQWMTGGGNILYAVNGPPADWPNPPGWTVVTGTPSKIGWNNWLREFQAGHSYFTLTDRHGAGTGGGNALLWPGF